MRFSIIIPAKNEEQMIGRCVEHLAHLDFPKEEFEVILADNGSKDRTVEVFGAWSDRLTLSVVEKPGVNISAARNAGVAASRGVLLAFLDADCLPPPNWLKNAAGLLESSDAGIVGAHYRIPPDSTWLPRCWFDDEHANRPGETPYIPSGSLLVSRSTFDRIGGFDETLQTNEDYDICQRAKWAGYLVRSYPELEVIHLGTPQTISGFYNKQKWHGLHVFRVFLENLPSFYNASVVFFALYTLLGLFLMLCGAVAAATGKTPLVFLGACVFALCGPIFLAGRATIQRRKINILAPLVLLYFLYGVARASCILESLFTVSVGRGQDQGRVSGSNRAAS
jgi:glycosyltransferase involved in cell wall biosynthesis